MNRTTFKFTYDGYANPLFNVDRAVLGDVLPSFTIWVKKANHSLEYINDARVSMYATTIIFDFSKVDTGNELNRGDEINIVLIW